jgi:hypothetical protein
MIRVRVSVRVRIRVRVQVIVRARVNQQDLGSQRRGHTGLFRDTILYTRFVVF